MAKRKGTSGKIKGTGQYEYGEWSHFGTCVYCKRGITREELMADQRVSVQQGHEIPKTFRWSKPPVSGRLPNIRFRSAHRTCYLKHMLGKRWRFHK